MKAEARSGNDDKSLDNHFEFGANWQELVGKISDEHLQSAIEDMTQFMNRSDLIGLSFLDVGCGSGLSSMAAYKLGAANITSVDIDPKNIANVNALKEKFHVPASAQWQSFLASIVDPKDFSKLPKADVVLSWGVLHHTGDMWLGIQNCMNLVNPGGYLYLMLYRDATLASTWKVIKRRYTRGGSITKWLILNSFAGILILGALAKGKNPLRIIRDYKKKSRGMEWYLDVRDWVGGYPFEYASADQTEAFVSKGGFKLENIYPKPDGKMNLGWRGTGNYTYLFRKV